MKFERLFGVAAGLALAISASAASAQSQYQGFQQQPGYGATIPPAPAYQQPGYGYQQGYGQPQPAGLQPAALAPLGGAVASQMTGNWTGDLVNPYGKFPVIVRITVDASGRITGEHIGYSTDDSGKGSWRAPVPITAQLDSAARFGYQLPNKSTWSDFRLDGSELVVTAVTVTRAGQTLSPVTVRLRRQG